MGRKGTGRGGRGGALGERVARPRAGSDWPEDRGGRGPPARSTAMLRLSSGSSTTSPAPPDPPRPASEFWLLNVHGGETTC